MVELAITAGRQTLTRFGQSDLAVDRKSDDSPVTAADRDAEQLTRDALAIRFPEDAVAGEEFGDKPGQNDYRWTIDPIDGTKSFICGVPLYSTLLALELGEQPIAGAIIIPALAQAVVATAGHGCFCSQDLSRFQRCHVSSQRELSQAVFVTSEAKTFGERASDRSGGDGALFDRLQAATWLTRTWGDGYGYLMVATGRADLMVDPICNAWDVAAMVPIMNEAGGRFTDWRGEPSVRGGDGLGTNGHLHEEVLALLQSP
ncbi:MAG: histidinol-phosphatase [Planctomycetota bacterium]